MTAILPPISVAIFKLENVFPEPDGPAMDILSLLWTFVAFLNVSAIKTSFYLRLTGLSSLNITGQPHP